MSQIGPSTDMLELLKNLQAILVKHRTFGEGLFKNIHSINRGVLKNPSRYPIIAILPVQEENHGITNGYIINARRVRFEVFSFHQKSKSALRQTIGIVDNIKELFKVRGFEYEVIDQVRKEPTVYNIDFVDTVVSQEPFPFRGGFIQSSSVDIDFYSKDPLYDNIKRVNHAKMVDSKTKPLIDHIMETYRQYKFEFNPRVKTFKDLSLPINLKYPVLFLSVEDVNRSMETVGYETTNYLIWLNIISKSVDANKSLDHVLQLSQTMRQILLANCDFGGRVLDYQYFGIEYGQLIQEGQMLYGSSLQVSLNAFEQVTQQEV